MYLMTVLNKGTVYVNNKYGLIIMASQSTVFPIIPGEAHSWWLEYIGLVRMVYLSDTEGCPALDFASYYSSSFYWQQ